MYGVGWRLSLKDCFLYLTVSRRNASAFSRAKMWLTSGTWSGGLSENEIARLINSIGRRASIHSSRITWRIAVPTSTRVPRRAWIQVRRAGRPALRRARDLHAGIEFHARRGTRVEVGQPFATLYATNESMLAEPIEFIKRAISFSDNAPDQVPLVSHIFARENAEAFLRDTVR